MKSFVISSPFGKENLRIEETQKPAEIEGNVTIRVKKAGLNPVDYNVINGKILYNLAPLPHVPGSEIYGTVETDGKHVKKGDAVIIYPRVFDGTCEYCLSGREYLCPNGGIWGVVSNGGYTDYVSVPEKQVFKLDRDMDSDIAVSLPVGGLTAYHALKRANAAPGQSVLVYGASGNTGTFAMQIAASMGLEVYAVSRNSWVTEFGATEVFSPNGIPDNFKVDIVIDSLGASFWENSVKHVTNGGSIVTFGVQTGRESKLDIGDLYTREIQMIGSTGGNRKELVELIKMTARKSFMVRVAKKFNLYDLKDAMGFFETKVGGRIILEN
ncbi:MAG: alcohol dehydrogenase [Thermoplasmatales archaeon B_DKE]|nr:MAG: alcohol dehydrogenase [Thermoplasmatales archaeon B_DKE]QRF75757.1 Acryloyl-coenzyme A reductase [Thermoplasmatales archaeon]